MIWQNESISLQKIRFLDKLEMTREWLEMTKEVDFSTSSK